MKNPKLVRELLIPVGQKTEASARQRKAMADLFDYLNETDEPRKTITRVILDLVRWVPDYGKSLPEVELEILYPAQVADVIVALFLAMPEWSAHIIQEISVTFGERPNHSQALVNDASIILALLNRIAPSNPEDSLFAQEYYSDVMRLLTDLMSKSRFCSSPVSHFVATELSRTVSRLVASASATTEAGCEDYWIHLQRMLRGSYPHLYPPGRPTLQSSSLFSALSLEELLCRELCFKMFNTLNTHTMVRLLLSKEEPEDKKK